MPATDIFDGYSDGLESPLSFAEGVTPSDTDTLTHVSRAVYLGGAGDLSVVMRGGQTVTFTAMSAGWHPIRVTQVMATGTSATEIVVCW